MKIIKFFITIVLFLFLSTSSSFSLIEVDITRGNLNPLPIAVSPLSQNSNSKKISQSKLNIEDLGSEIAKVIENEKLKVEFRLWDVLAAREMLGLAFTTVPSNWRRVGHIITDKVYERLTGEKGYFDTRIIYVSEEGPKTQRVKKLAIMDQDGFNTKYLTLGNELVLTPRFNPTNQMVTYLSYFRNLPRVYLLEEMQ